eukprot:c18505_g1_i1.p1 GENE.c18505_g1_i1~~c18505_g1_i1.p1  ORF type:complete len:161 (+),score=20.68 c18505_g1_i1:2-484(+)
MGTEKFTSSTTTSSRPNSSATCETTTRACASCSTSTSGSTSTSSACNATATASTTFSSSGIWEKSSANFCVNTNKHREWQDSTIFTWPVESERYEVWLTDVSMWTRTTECSRKSQATTLYLELPHTAKQMVMSITNLMNNLKGWHGWSVSSTDEVVFARR